jgi:hypothetical protein
MALSQLTVTEFNALIAQAAGYFQAQRERFVSRAEPLSESQIAVMPSSPMKYFETRGQSCWKKKRCTILSSLRSCAHAVLNSCSMSTTSTNLAARGHRFSP